MKLKKLKHHRKHSRWLDGVFYDNPIFIGGLALPFAVMITTSLKNSAIISILLTCSLIPSVLLSQLIGQRLSRVACAVIYALFSMAIVVTVSPMVLRISPELMDNLGIYIPILSINSILLCLCERSRRESYTPGRALIDAVFYSLGAALALCLLGAVRELVGNNSLWGVAVSFPFKASGVEIAFCGFILVAFCGALFHTVRRGILQAMYRRENPLEREEDWI